METKDEEYQQKPYEPTKRAEDLLNGEQFSVKEWGEVYVRLNPYAVRHFKMPDDKIWACDTYSGSIRGFAPDRIVHKREVRDTIRRDVEQALQAAFPSKSERHDEEEERRIRDLTGEN